MEEILDVPQRQIDLRYVEYCGLWPRLGALIIDSLIVGVFSKAVGFALAQSSDLELNALVSIFISIVAYLYYPLMEGSSGATLGKKALKMVVVTEQFENISYKQSFLRSIFRLVSVLFSAILMLYITFSATSLYSADGGLFGNGMSTLLLAPAVIFVLFLLDLIVMMGNNQYQSLHDKIAGTVVVRANSIQKWAEQ